MQNERISWVQSHPSSKGIHSELVTLGGTLDSVLHDGTILVRPDYNRNVLILMRDPRPAAKKRKKR
jgi:hypothetical protein